MLESWRQSDHHRGLPLPSAPLAPMRWHCAVVRASASALLQGSAGTDNFRGLCGLPPLMRAYWRRDKAVLIHRRFDVAACACRSKSRRYRHFFRPIMLRAQDNPAFCRFPYRPRPAPSPGLALHQAGQNWRRRRRHNPPAVRVIQNCCQAFQQGADVLHREALAGCRVRLEGYNQYNQQAGSRSSQGGCRVGLLAALAVPNAPEYKAPNSSHQRSSWWQSCRLLGGRHRGLRPDRQAGERRFAATTPPCPHHFGDVPDLIAGQVLPVLAGQIVPAGQRQKVPSHLGNDQFRHLRARRSSGGDIIAPPPKPARQQAPTGWGG